MLTIGKYNHLPGGQRKHFKEKNGFEKIFLLKFIQMGAVLFANKEWGKKNTFLKEKWCACMFAHLCECACAW